MIIAYNLILTIAKITLRLELKLGQGPTYSINGSFGSPEKKIGINFTKANVKVCSSLLTVLFIVICLLMDKKSFENRV